MTRGWEANSIIGLAAPVVARKAQVRSSAWLDLLLTTMMHSPSRPRGRAGGSARLHRKLPSARARLSARSGFEEFGPNCASSKLGASCKIVDPRLAAAKLALDLARTVTLAPLFFAQKIHSPFVPCTAPGDGEIRKLHAASRALDCPDHRSECCFYLFAISHAL